MMSRPRRFFIPLNRNRDAIIRITDDIKKDQIERMSRFF